MRLSLSTRLSLAGMLGLAMLSATHWARAAFPKPGAGLGFLLGVLPNFTAGFAMPLILASMLPSVSGGPGALTANRRFLLLLLVTSLGLCAWEVIQARSERFVFDPNDIAATLLGAMVAFLIYRWLIRADTRDVRL